MVQIQIRMDKNLSKYMGIQKEIYGVKTKSEAIIKILEEKYVKDIGLKKKLEGGLK